MKLVSIRQDLEEQEGSQDQPYSAQGLVGAWPLGYPVRKGEDLVRLGFSICNPSNIPIL
jgi:hypothetical protein